MKQEESMPSSPCVSRAGIAVAIAIFAALVLALGYVFVIGSGRTQRQREAAAEHETEYREQSRRVRAASERLNNLGSDLKGEGGKRENPR